MGGEEFDRVGEAGASLVVLDSGLLWWQGGVAAALMDGETGSVKWKSAPFKTQPPGSTKEPLVLEVDNFIVVAQGVQGKDYVTRLVCLDRRATPCRRCRGLRAFGDDDLWGFDVAVDAGAGHELDAVIGGDVAVHFAFHRDIAGVHGRFDAALVPISRSAAMSIFPRTVPSTTMRSEPETVPSMVMLGR